MHDCTRLAEEPLAVRTAAARVQARCETLYTYLANKMESLVDYGRRYRNGLPISSSRAEGSVDDLANARMGKRRRMRWSPKGGTPSSRHKGRSSRWSADRYKQKTRRMTPMFCPLPAPVAQLGNVLFHRARPGQCAHLHAIQPRSRKTGHPPQQIRIGHSSEVRTAEIFSPHTAQDNGS
jgi:hypothetical protein